MITATLIRKTLIGAGSQFQGLVHYLLSGVQADIVLENELGSLFEQHTEAN